LTPSAGISVITKEYLQDIMYARRRAPLAEAVLFMLSVLYGFAVRLRRIFYGLGLLPRRKLPVRVISVGNLTLGGTGKTPTVIHIAGMLSTRHRRPVVLSRGYGRKNESELVLVSDGDQVLVGAGSGGDEPVLIATRLSGVPVVAGKDRYRSGLFALERFNPDTVILDDGFQHLRLRRDADIVLVDATDAFGNGKLFPAGILREPLSALGRADAVLITRADRATDLEALKAALQQHTRARIFTSHQEPRELVDSVSGDITPLSALRNTAALVFSGIARPASLSALLSSLGASIKEEMIFPDHYEYDRSDLAAIYQKAADHRVSLIITTEKDAVRLKDLRPEGILALRIDLELHEPEDWERMILSDL